MLNNLLIFFTNLLYFSLVVDERNHKKLNLI